jgi:hypothetical protein
MANLYGDCGADESAPGNGMSIGIHSIRTNEARQPRAFTFGARLIPAIVLIGIVNAGASARASCGDHVQSRWTRDLLERIVAAHQPSRPAPAAPSAPCRGPGCDRGPVESPVVPAPVTNDDAGKPAIRAERSLLFADQGEPEESVAFSIVLRDGVLAGVFRPPERNV